MVNTGTLESNKLEARLPVLYDIPPIAAGTMFVENMQHYVNRIAEAHCVSPRALLKYLRSPYLSVRRQLDGPGEESRRLVRLLSALSPRNDIQLTSLGRWHSVMSSKHCIEPRPRHCPLCAAENPSYTRLIWSIKVVTVCPIHGILLIPKGEKVVKFPDRKQLLWQHYVHSQLNDLLTYNEFPTLVGKEFATLFFRLLQSVSNRTRRDVPQSHTYRLLHIANGWKYTEKSHAPALLTSLMLAEHLDIPLIKLLTGEV